MFKEFVRPFRYEKVQLVEPEQDEQLSVQAMPVPGRHAPVQKQKPKNFSETIRKIWSYLATHKGKLFLVLLMVLLSSAMALLGPFLIGRAVDIYIVERQTSGLTVFLFGLAAVYGIHSISVWFQNYWMIGIAQATVYTMRVQLFRHLHRLPIPYFDRRQHGEIMSRVTNDIENVSNTLNSSVIQIFSSILTLIGTVTVMLWLSPLLTFITFAVIPLMFFGLKWITKRTRLLFKGVQTNLGELNGFIEETLSGQQIVKVFSQEKRVIASFQSKNEQLKQVGFWAQVFSGFIPKLMHGLNNLNFAIVAGFGGYLAFKGVISIGVIVIFTEYTRQFTRPLSDLANQFNTLLSAIAGAERVFSVLDEKEERQDEQHARNLDKVKGKVCFEQVSFAYEEGEETIQNVTFQTEPGQMIAFVGPTGAGKTTLINLLSRFYDVNSGAITIDGQNITEIKRESLRSHMGFVLQDTFLFEGSVMENIRYGRLEATDEEVIQAAEMANADDFIRKMPKGYDSLLDHQGGGISQGQKQLLSIARAILANPSILILDEATSSIDTVTELKIQEALQRLMAGRTSFVIAHRLNTVQRADQIVVLSEGSIVEKGTHDELLHQNGFYSKLYFSQLQAGAF